MSAQKPAGPLGNRRLVLEVGEHVITRAEALAAVYPGAPFSDRLVGDGDAALGEPRPVPIGVRCSLSTETAVQRARPRDQGGEGARTGSGERRRPATIGGPV